MATSNTTRNIPTSNLPLRAGKGYLYEGGIKVPAIIRWSGHLKGRQVSDTPIIGTDYYPTLLDLCGLPLLPGRSFHETRLTGRTAVQTFLILALSSL